MTTNHPLTTQPEPPYVSPTTTFSSEYVGVPPELMRETYLIVCVCMPVTKVVKLQPAALP